MSNEILVFAEHQGGKLTRPTWEAIAAGQQLGQEFGAAVSAVILGDGVSGLASELAAAVGGVGLSNLQMLVMSIVGGGLEGLFVFMIRSRMRRKEA